MKKLDLSILFNKPDKDVEVILMIEPLAPLSIVSTMPGSYYKSLNKPTKANLCGMFENVMGWHIGKKDRNQIIKKMKAVYKKSFKITDTEFETSKVGYNSLLGHLFDIELPLTPVIICRYDDLWTQQLKHNDKRHMDGSANLSWQVIKQKINLREDLKEIENNKTLDSKNKKKEIDKITNDFVKKNLSKLPMYYSKPITREFIVIDQAYEYKLNINENLYNQLLTSIDENNHAYLGTNEGWVNLSFKKL